MFGRDLDDVPTEHWRGPEAIVGHGWRSRRANRGRFWRPGCHRRRRRRRTGRKEGPRGRGAQIHGCDSERSTGQRFGRSVICTLALRRPGTRTFNGIFSPRSDEWNHDESEATPNRRVAAADRGFAPTELEASRATERAAVERAAASACSTPHRARSVDGPGRPVAEAEASFAAAQGVLNKLREVVAKKERQEGRLLARRAAPRSSTPAVTVRKDSRRARKPETSSSGEAPR